MGGLIEKYSYFYAPFMKESYESDEEIFRTRYKKSWYVLFVIIMVALPPFLNDYHLYYLGLIGVTIIGVMGFNILTGYTGLVSLGHAAFIGVGAYTYAIIVTKLQWPFYVGIIFGGIVAAFFGMIIGIPSLRIKGIYLAIGTLAFQFIAEYVFVHWETVTGGSNGLVIAPPQLMQWKLMSNISFYYLTSIALFLALWIAKNLFRSKYGRAMMAIRDNDVSAEIIGIPVFRYKVLAFGISSFYAGVSGALFGILMRNAYPSSFGLDVSIQYLAMVIVGGMGTILGSILGACFLLLVPEALSILIGYISVFFADPGEIAVMLSPAKFVVFGLSIVLFIIIEPTGLAGIWRKIRDYLRIWPLPYV